ncbi:MAG TPA: type VI secretion system-associated protein TagO [Stellaceae bacterium]|nr:type VI secretion system-associated protein TagO [Stellaceae bacterium]
MRRALRPLLLGALLTGGAVLAQAQQQELPGRWELTQFDPSGVTGDSQSALWLEAEGRILNPEPSDPHAVRVLPVLSIQCRNATPDFFLKLNFEAPSGSVAVSYSLDGGPPMQATWQPRDDATALAPDDKVDFVRALEGKNRLDLTLTFPDAEPTSTSFDLTGIDAALAKLRPACTW